MSADYSAVSQWADLCDHFQSALVFTSGVEKASLASLIVNARDAVPSNLQALHVVRYMLFDVCGISPNSISLPDNLEFDYGDMRTFSVAVSLGALKLTSEQSTRIAQEACFYLYKGDRINASYALIALNSCPLTDSLAQFWVDAHKFLTLSAELFPHGGLSELLMRLKAK